MPKKGFSKTASALNTKHGAVVIHYDENGNATKSSYSKVEDKDNSKPKKENNVFGK